MRDIGGGSWRGRRGRGVPEKAAEKIFAKLNGQYMFPESHSHAFAVTAYQAAWLKRYYPLEFFVALVNNQPMGFYPVETLKQDARRFGVPFLNPCVNRSGVNCIPEAGSLRLGLRSVRDVGARSAQAVVAERERGGPYLGPGDLARRSGLKPQALRSLVLAGAFDDLNPNRRQVLWEAGLRRPARPARAERPCRSWPAATPELADFSDYEKMAGEYRVMGIYPKGHLMQFVRPTLDPRVLPAAAVERAEEGEQVLVAGWPVARQHPRGQDGTVFVTIEDETGDVQLIIWPPVFARYRRQLQSRVVLAKGAVSRWDGAATVIVSDLRAIDPCVPMPETHDWR